MDRRVVKYFVTPVVLLFVLSAGLVLIGKRERHPFARGKVAVGAGYTNFYHGHGMGNSFAGGKMWIYGTMANDWETYYFNIETREIEGVLERDSWPLVFDEKNGLLLTFERKTPSDFPQVVRLLRKAGFLREQEFDTVTYRLWRDGENAPVAEWAIREKQHYGGGGQESPDGGYYRFFTSLDEHKLIDLRARTMTELPPIKDSTEGWMGGWWSETEILYVDPADHLTIYDVRTKKAETLMTAGDLRRFLQEHGLDFSEPNNYAILSSWRGGAFDFYLADKYYNQKNHWLIKIDKRERTLELISKSFPFMPFGNFGEGEKYVSSGFTVEENRDGVYMFDPVTSSTLVVVPEKPGNNEFSFPKFYGDRIIYAREGAIWSVKMDGSDNVKFFPPGK